MHVTFPVAVGAISGLLGGLLVSDVLPGLLFRRGRFGPLPINQAKYLDKIVE